ncbi:methyl-accepting chemotaxis protein [Criblamydia sequanensis]|uniref:Chemotaxis signal transduction protein n=1 Tax=Candidatus Criblamydia sequanensis CRIB-18 TaxID=1437425 RepID=A0A090CZ63_9BACT|nr:CHASE3 domain-containing protein [Criblamydia sequanensis]CDR34207.1 Chemotaxis signal transduction protein [Criblamydia sequanensis CRIB-18]
MKWNVKMKIAAGFAFALLMLIIIGLISLRSTIILIDTSKQVTRSYDILGTLNTLLSNLKDAETGQRGFIITGRSSYLEPYLKAKEQVDQNIMTLKELLSENQKQKLDRLESLIYDKFEELHETIEVRKNDSKGFEEARQIVLTDSGKVVMDEIRNLLNQIEAEENNLLRERTEKAHANAQRSLYFIVIGTIITFISLFAITYLLTRNISDPLNEISKFAGKISEGDLNVKLLNNNRFDEVGLLTQSFNHMTKSLKEMADVATQIASGDLRVSIKPQSNKDVLGNAFLSMVDSLRHMTKELLDAINILESSVTEIVSSTGQLTSIANEIAMAIMQTTTAIEEMHQTAQIFNQRAKQVTEESEQAIQTSESGVKSAENVVIGMNRIKQQTDAISTSMNQLSLQSQSIVKIIDTVEELSSQSKLLSVNASLEASKAGDHGKGFHVVAQEMKRLTEQSEVATKQVRTILNDVQKAIQSAVAATVEGGDVINEGVRQTEIAENSIQALALTVFEAAKASTQIENSSEQQLKGIEQMALAINSIKDSTDKNLSCATLLETSGKNLNELGDQLKKMVDSYKV